VQIANDLTIEQRVEHAYHLLDHAQISYDSFSDGRSQSLAMLSIATSLAIIADQLSNRNLIVNTSVIP